MKRAATPSCRSCASWRASGSDPELSVQDALAQRYIITAVPA
jgi:hypothetical protein